MTLLFSLYTFVVLIVALLLFFFLFVDFCCPEYVVVCVFLLFVNFCGPDGIVVFFVDFCCPDSVEDLYRARKSSQKIMQVTVLVLRDTLTS